jgi:hypothetical protein
MPEIKHDPAAFAAAMALPGGALQALPGLPDLGAPPRAAAATAAAAAAAEVYSVLNGAGYLSPLGRCGDGGAASPAAGGQQQLQQQQQRATATWSGSFDSSATCVDFGGHNWPHATPTDMALHGRLQLQHAVSAPMSQFAAAGLPPASPAIAPGASAAVPRGGFQGHSATASPSTDQRCGAAALRAGTAAAEYGAQPWLLAAQLSEQEEQLRQRVSQDSGLREQLHERLQLLQRRQERAQQLQALLQQQQAQALQQQQLYEQQRHLAQVQQQLHALHRHAHSHMLLPQLSEGAAGALLPYGFGAEGHPAEFMAAPPHADLVAGGGCALGGVHGCHPHHDASAAAAHALAYEVPAPLTHGYAHAEAQQLADCGQGHGHGEIDLAEDVDLDMLLDWMS